MVCCLQLCLQCITVQSSSVKSATAQPTAVSLTWHRSSQQLLQVVSEEQLVACDLEASTKEESPTNALEHLIWQRVLVGRTSLSSDHLDTEDTQFTYHVLALLALQRQQSSKLAAKTGNTACEVLYS